jgi:signal transduction histidine kinase/CheY-like chemotaxis protein
MKKFYIIFFALPVLAFTLLYLSTLWLIVGIAAVMVFIAYRFFAERVEAAQAKAELLEQELDGLHRHLETVILQEQKTRKEADQIRQLKQQLLSVLSHEVRTPMNGVMGMSLLLSETSLTKEQEEYVTTIRNCGEGLLTTVNNMLANDILDFSKLQQEGKQLEYKDFGLRDSIEEVLDMFSEKIGKNGVDLVYQIEDDVPEQIIGDSKRLRQVLMNLVENSVRHTLYGEVYIGVTFSQHLTTGHPPELHFEIRDTGVGIPKEQMKQLFKGIPGKQPVRGFDPQPSGTGLGLVICKKLVELMGGSIEAKSETGQGTTITFTMPLTPSLKTAREHARHGDMIRLESKQVLVIDDNAVSRNNIIRQLKAWKMIPFPAESANEAMAILQNNSFDLVLADMIMPRIDGIELARSIRSAHPDLQVIAMNPGAQEKYRLETELFSSVINKPIRQAVLRDQLLSVFAPIKTDKQNHMEPLPTVFAEQYPLRILIAEDNPINQKIAVKMLNKLGYQPSVANHGKEVMETVSHDNYDIILMDVQMPEMDGLEATRMIRTCLEAQPVIIALTANAMQGDRDECMQAGMDDYMSKPIDPKLLLNQLEKWALALREKKRMSA